LETRNQPKTNPPTKAEEVQEDRFEKSLVDPDTKSPHHLNLYTKTILGIMLLVAMVVFYFVHNATVR
jgi:hypothetical protein